MSIVRIIIAAVCLTMTVTTQSQQRTDSVRQSRRITKEDLAHHATTWDLISSKYIDFISNTYMGNLIQDTHDAYALLMQTDEERH